MRRHVMTYGQAILRQKAEVVQNIDDEVRLLVKDMLETMVAEDGIGLAAEQVGLARAICVIDVPADQDRNDAGERLNPDIAMPLIMINPEIQPKGKRRESEAEGCLSFPGVSASITRPYRITARFTDLENQTHEIELCDLVARAVQHEVDHLNGVLLVDRMSTVKRVSLSGTLKRLKAESAA